MPPEPTAIRLLSPLLHGDEYFEPGSVVLVEAGRAASLIRDGHAIADDDAPEATDPAHAPLGVAPATPLVDSHAPGRKPRR